NLKDAAQCVGALGISLSLLYSISVETAFQSLAALQVL
ncbi:MAG: hypothetical protein KR126chlam6_00866, partial [Candidatus Anoxychlamydiales bacterium]|nr:hypothetical protein [Candidatus Anoxychlamydiales bacterium]